MTFLLVGPRRLSKFPEVATSALSVAALLRVAEDLRSDPASILEMVTAITTDRGRWKEVIRQSYWHRNGFAKIKLFEGSEYSIRLHVWPAGKDRRGDMNPHGHRWSFASWLVLGQGMTEKHFVETAPADPDGIAYDRYCYRRRSCLRDLRQGERVHLREVGHVDRPAGAVYSCDTDVIHTVDPLGLGLLVTAVVQGRAEVETTPVYVHPGVRDKQRHRRLKAKEFDLLLRDLEIAMGAMPRT
jgi:hypothetical protein